MLRSSTNLSEVDPTFASRLYRSIAAMLVERLRLTSMDLFIQKPWVWCSAGSAQRQQHHSPTFSRTELAILRSSNLLE